MSTATHSPDIRRHILETAQRIMGQKGFSAVGLNEILTGAGVPKGSFYHYFTSKESFGEALLETYFAAYMDRLDAVLERPGACAADRLMDYWQGWLETQAGNDPHGKCLAVKLGAEVADLSEPMRAVLERGTGRVIARLAQTIKDGLEDGSLQPETEPLSAAQTLYQTWLGATLLAKITRNTQPLTAAMAATRRLLRLDAA